MSRLPRNAHSHGEAEVEHIVSTLRTYGVLTRPRLVELSGAGRWHEASFGRALALAVLSGRVRRLGHDLYAIADDDADAARIGSS